MLLRDKDMREKSSSVLTLTRIEDTRDNQLDFSTVFFCCHYKLCVPNCQRKSIAAKDERKRRQG